MVFVHREKSIQCPVLPGTCYLSIMVTRGLSDSTSGLNSAACRESRSRSPPQQALGCEPRPGLHRLAVVSPATCPQCLHPFTWPCAGGR